MFVSILLLAVAPTGSCLAQEGITAEQYDKYIRFLAADKLEGRFPGTKGNDKAAAYIRKQFKEYGLNRWHTNFYQPFYVKLKKQTNSITRDSVLTNNVIAYLPGNDPLLKDEYIVLGAHYDHLGWGGKGTGSKKPDTLAIHNGAIDNASGTAALLCIAREVSKKKLNKRSIIFIAFSGEEEGLVGSKFFTNHLPVPDTAIKLMSNIDILGCLNAEKQLYMGGAGTFPGGMELLKGLGNGSGLNPIVIAGGVGGSDHVSFYKRNKSVLGFHTGGYPQYHTPEDDIEFVNTAGAVQSCQYIYKALLAIANYNQPIYFIKQD
ncbi:MAG: M28 family peptidase [Chitinophagaceae bacterium]|nr:M28 family peptidase [Chitinophagaceae bacterium]